MMLALKQKYKPELTEHTETNTHGWSCLIRGNKAKNISTGKDSFVLFCFLKVLAAKERIKNRKKVHKRGENLCALILSEGINNKNI